jgi:hypothetical protein
MRVSARVPTQDGKAMTVQSAKAALVLAAQQCEKVFNSLKLVKVLSKALS